MRVYPDKITTFSVNDREIRQDAEGYLVDPDDWDEDVAKVLAAREGVDLANDHWAIIAYMRDWYFEHGVAVDARIVMKFIAGKKGVDKKKSRALLFELFPHGYVQQACKIAGMKQPRAWSTG